MSAASTSSRPRSRRPCSPIPTSPTPPSSASPTSMGEALVAYVSQRPGADLNTRDLIAFARSRIAGYRCRTRSRSSRVAAPPVRKTRSKGPRRMIDALARNWLAGLQPAQLGDLEAAMRRKVRARARHLPPG